jgi:hypothetical protein
MLNLSRNCHLNLNASLNVDNDLLDDLSGRVKASTVSIIVSIDFVTKIHMTYSIKRLWILISNVSQVFEPSPQGVFRVVILRVLVGKRTGPLTRRSLDLARSMSSWHTFSREATFLLVRVMRIL